MSEPIPSTPDQEQTELEKLLRSSKPWFEKNATLLIYGLAGVLAIAAIYVFVNRQPAGDEQATQELYDALLGGQGLRPEAFRDLADNYSGTPLEQWARLRQSEQLYADALNNLFSNREVGRERLASARTTFDSLVALSGVDDRIRQRAMIGLAKVTEAECDGSEESAQEAIDAWQLVLTSYEDSIMKEQIEARIESLGKEDTRQFYAWFQKQNPKPAEIPDIPAGKTDGSASESETDESAAAGDEEPAGDSATLPEENAEGSAKPEEVEMPSEPASETPDNAAGSDQPTKEEQAPPESVEEKPTEGSLETPAADPTETPVKKPDAAKPTADAPKVDAPKVEVPKADPPKADEPPAKSDDPS